jgi:hypothetical protein
VGYPGPKGFVNQPRVVQRGEPLGQRRSRARARPGHEPRTEPGRWIRAGIHARWL